MADTEGKSEAKNFYPKNPAMREAFLLKGSHLLDWGMQNRLLRIVQPVSGRTVLLAFDHGYFQGPTTGLRSGWNYGTKLTAGLPWPEGGARRSLRSATTLQ